MPPETTNYEIGFVFIDGPGNLVDEPTAVATIVPAGQLKGIQAPLHRFRGAPSAAGLYSGSVRLPTPPKGGHSGGTIFIQYGSVVAGPNPFEYPFKGKPASWPLYFRVQGWVHEPVRETTTGDTKKDSKSTTNSKETTDTVSWKVTGSGEFIVKVNGEIAGKFPIKLILENPLAGKETIVASLAAGIPEIGLVVSMIKSLEVGLEAAMKVGLEGSLKLNLGGEYGKTNSVKVNDSVTILLENTHTTSNTTKVTAKLATKRGSVIQQADFRMAEKPRK